LDFFSDHGVAISFAGGNAEEFENPRIIEVSRDMTDSVELLTQCPFMKTAYFLPDGGV
jgi:hypothetical protein